MFGRLSGLGATELTWYLTFSDFVNLAPATLMLVGIFAGIATVNDSRIRKNLDERQPGEAVRWLPITLLAVFIAAIIAAVVWTPSYWRGALTLILLCPIFVFVSRAIRTNLAPRYGSVISNTADSAFAAVFICFVAGYFLGVLQDMRMGTVTVCTPSGVTEGKLPIALERGLAFVKHEKFTLISWNEIKWTEYVFEQSKDAQPRICK